MKHEKITDGKKYVRLTVVKSYHSRSSGSWRHKCICDCGQVRLVYDSSIKQGLTRSCGCLHREELSKRITKHGGINKPEYEIWAGMRRRCSKTNKHGSLYYSDRGITVCKRWDDFALFLLDMGKRPPGMSIDRIDNNKGYSPKNCRWASPSQQIRNSRAAKLKEYEVKIMRHLHKRGLKPRHLSKIFHVTRGTVTAIVSKNSKIWIDEPSRNISR